jgi:hypothetical protein
MWCRNTIQKCVLPPRTAGRRPQIPRLHLRWQRPQQQPLIGHRERRAARQAWVRACLSQPRRSAFLGALHFLHWRCLRSSCHCEPSLSVKGLPCRHILHFLVAMWPKLLTSSCTKSMRSLAPSNARSQQQHTHLGRASSSTLSLCPDRAPPPASTHGHPPASSPAASHACCRRSYRRAFLRATVTAIGRPKPYRGVRGGLGHTICQTVRTTLSWMTLDVGRPASKAAPRLARAQLPSMVIPRLRSFCAGDAYRARRQTIRWGAPVRASAKPPRVGWCRQADTPVTVGTPPSSMTSLEWYNPTPWDHSEPELAKYASYLTTNA